MPVSKEGLTNSSNKQNLMQESGGNGEITLTFLFYLVQLMQRFKLDIGWQLVKNKFQFNKEDHIYSSKILPTFHSFYVIPKLVLHFHVHISMFHVLCLNLLEGVLFVGHFDSDWDLWHHSISQKVLNQHG